MVLYHKNFNCVECDARGGKVLVSSKVYPLININKRLFFIITVELRACYLGPLLLGDEVIDTASLLQRLLHLDQLVDAVTDPLHQLHLAVAQTVGVGDVVGTARGSCVYTTCVR